MSFPLGSDVIVIAINRRGRVIDARGGVYRVLVGALTLSCREHELRPSAAATRARSPRRSAPHGSPAVVELPAAGVPPAVRSIDLHGMTVEQARTAVIDFLSRAILDGADTLEIVHGIGTGRVRDAVRRQLQSMAAVRRVYRHPTNPGVTLVCL